jgi:hypothetical protein
MTPSQLRAHTREVDLAEFDRLRQEIDNRTQLSTSLVVADLTALGAGLSVFGKVPEVAIALAGVSSFLWLLWLDHTAQIYKVAAYISLRIAPRLQQGLDHELLGWELFLRRLDSGDGDAVEALYGTAARRSLRRTIPVMPTHNIARYTMILFGAGPLVLLGIAGVRQLATNFHPHDSGDWIRMVSLVVTIGLWAVACGTYRRFCRARDALSKAVLDVGAWRADGTGADMGPMPTAGLTTDRPARSSSPAGRGTPGPLPPA